MDSLTQPLEALRARVHAFLARDPRRVLVVEVDQPLATAARNTLEGLEWHPENRRSFFTFERSSERQGGWLHWTRLLGQAFEELAEAYRAEGLVLEPLGPEPETSSGFLPLQAFADRLGRVAARLSTAPAPTARIVALFAWGEAHEDSQGEAALARELAALVLAKDPALSPVKFIVLTSEAVSRVVGPELKGRPEVQRVACHVDQASLEAERAAIFGALDRGGPGIPGEAWPDEAPPRHPLDPPAPSTSKGEDLEAPALAALRAARALWSDDPFRAMGHMKDAAKATRMAGHQMQALELELTGVLMVAPTVRAKDGHTADLRRAVRELAARARSSGCQEQEARAWLAAGALAAADRQSSEAVEDYRHAADAAKAVEAHGQAIEALLLAGGTAEDEARRLRQPGLEDVAARAFREAMSLAEELPIEDARATRAGEVAQRLAAYHRARSEAAEARRYAERAKALARGQA